MNKGYLIEELKLAGKDLPTASVIFKQGLNVISGPSNTGKTFIYQCINYMLGSSKIPKNIKEARAYSRIYLRIRTKDNKVFTLESDLKGGNFILHKDFPKEPPETLNRKHDPDREDNISAFLLKLNGLYDTKIRVNAKGKTRKLSYRDLIKFLMVDETRIITDKSPILSGQYTSATEEENVFKFILSGQDDSDVIESLTVKEITHRKGKVELLVKLIYDLKNEIDAIGDSPEYENQIEKLDFSLKNFENQHKALQEEFSMLDKERTRLGNELSGLKSKKIYLDELIFRSKILKEQYQTDHERLKSTIEASHLLMDNVSATASCPVCNGPIGKNNYSEENVERVLNSCKIEVSKIVSLQSELLESEDLLKSESEEISKQIYNQELSISALESRLKEGVTTKLNSVLLQINNINNAKNNLLHLSLLKNRIQDYEHQKSSLENTFTNNDRKEEYSVITTSLATDLSNIIQNILIACNYSDNTTVSFSEEKVDFVISGEDRELAGKGYRAITYAAFIIGLQELIFTSKINLGIPVLDSPLVTYRKPIAGKEGISIDLAMDFYRYLADDGKVFQCIILENEEPPVDILPILNHIKFTQSKEHGRYGFIPLQE